MDAESDSPLRAGLREALRDIGAKSPDGDALSILHQAALLTLDDRLISSTRLFSGIVRVGSATQGSCSYPAAVARIITNDPSLAAQYDRALAPFKFEPAGAALERLRSAWFSPNVRNILQTAAQEDSPAPLSEAIVRVLLNYNNAHVHSRFPIEQLQSKLPGPSYDPWRIIDQQLRELKILVTPRVRELLLHAAELYATDEAIGPDHLYRALIAAGQGRGRPVRPTDPSKILFDISERVPSADQQMPPRIILAARLTEFLQQALKRQAEAFLNPALGTKGLVAAFLSMSADDVKEVVTLAAVNLAEVRALFLATLRERSIEEPTTPEVAQRTDGLLDQWTQALALTPTRQARLNNDQPSSGPPRDRLGIANDAIAIANVAAGQSTSLPLAFGIFGDWGAGKTFFMRLVRDQIVRIVSGHAENDGFEHAIVQIQFNAWHYAETNLWASLVGHIFDELDRWMTRSDGASTEPADAVQKRLHTSRQLTLEAATELAERRKENAKAAAELGAAQKQLTQAQENAETLPLLAWQAAWETARTAIANDTDLKQQLAPVLSALDMSGTAENKAKLALALDDIERSASASSAALAALRGVLGSPTTVLLAIATLVGVPILLIILRQLLSIVPTFAEFKDIGRGFETFAGFLATGAVLLRSFAGRAQSIADRLIGLRQRIDQKVAEAMVAERTKVSDAEADVAKSAAAVEQAKSVLQASGEQVAAALRDFADEAGGVRLRRFVRSRAGEDGYAKHLGLVSTIRRDFEQLESLMLNDGKPPEHLEEARKHYKVRVDALLASAGDALLEKEREELEATATSLRDLNIPENMRFRRIVLYIDDLDRCEPETVVEVLQAVNMLLSFRLFVVMVAVDARWLSRSLEAKYKDFFGSRGGVPNGAGQPTGDSAAARTADRSGPLDASDTERATPADYLEKIFQVPYWVPRMSDTASITLVGDLLNPDRQMRFIEASPDFPEPTSEPLPAWLSIEAEDDQPATLEPPSRALALTSGEIKALTDLAPALGGSPRRARRFVNVYRVAKAALTPDEITNLEKHDARALATQLAIATGSPNIFGIWLAACRDNEQQIQERLSEEAIRDRLGDLVISDDEWHCFRKALDAYTPSANRSAAVMRALAAQALRAARFSFVMPRKMALSGHQETAADDNQ